MIIFPGYRKQNPVITNKILPKSVYLVLLLAKKASISQTEEKTLLIKPFLASKLNNFLPFCYGFLFQFFIRKVITNPGFNEQN